MLTIAEILQNPVFETATVVAGEKGLNNLVEWLHIIDVADVVGMVEPGHLILTTGQGISHDDPDEQKQYISELAEGGISGLIISIGGQVFEDIPQAMVDEAKRHDFPMITVPASIRFVNITRIVHEKLINRQYELLKQSDHIHQTLTQIVLEGGGLQELAEALADLVERSVTIEDPGLHLMAHARHGEIDPAREESIAGGGTPASIREIVTERGILQQMKESLKPVFVPAWPDVGMTKDRIVAPIVVGREIYGYVWLIAGGDPLPLDVSDRLAIERAAIVAALIMIKVDAIHQTEARLQADVISQLLSGQTESLVLKDKANRLGLDLQQPQRVVLLYPPPEILPSLKLADSLSQSIRKLTQRHIIQPLGQHLILILPDQVDARELSQILVEALPGLKTAIGRSASALVNLAESYKEAEEALDIGLTLAPHSNIYDFDDLGFLHWLYHLPQVTQMGNPYIQRIQRLADEERAARADLLHTLEVYLDCGGNASETARALQIHRNTLTYRLKQIEHYCGVSLADPENRLNLQIAIKAYHLRIDTASRNGM